MKFVTELLFCCMVIFYGFSYYFEEKETEIKELEKKQVADCVICQTNDSLKNIQIIEEVDGKQIISKPTLKVCELHVDGKVKESGSNIYNILGVVCFAMGVVFMFIYVVKFFEDAKDV